MIESFIINDNVINQFEHLIIWTLFNTIFELKEIKLVCFHADWMINSLKTLIWNLLNARLIIKLSFKLTFWIQLDSKSSCSYFQLDATRFNWKLNQLDLIHQELELDVKKAKYRNFSDFCITFLHYLFDRKSWRKNMKIVW